MLMTMVVSPVSADEFGSEDVTMQVGETRTLYVPDYILSKTLKDISFYSHSYYDVEVLSQTDFSVKIKALKATSTPVVVSCYYHYFTNNGGFMYLVSGTYDYIITAKGETIVKPTNISIPSTSSVEVGSSFYFVPTVTPANAKYTITWKSNDSSIASVNQSGMLTGISVGTAIITATTDNGKTATCKITVSAKPVTNVSIKSNLTLEAGETYTLTPSITPYNAVASFIWSTDNNTVATVSQSGVVTAKSVGTANITVKTTNGKTATCQVTVTTKSVTSVSIPSSLSLESGETYTLTPTVTPSDATTSYTWSSDNSNVATVSQSGVVSAKNAGTANIAVKTDNGKTATCKVTVSGKSVTSVNIKSSLSMKVGETYTLTPTITPSDAVTSYTWSSDNSNVAMVSQTGVVTAKNAGTASVTVKTENGKTATCKIIVEAPAVVEHEVNFSIYGYEHGRVLYNGAKLVGSDIEDYGSFKVAEGSDVALTILPNEGYKIEWVWLDWEDVADQLVNNVLTIRNISADTKLVVSFEKDDEPVVIVPVYLYCNVGDGGYITHGNTTIMGENKIGVGEGDDITIEIVANEGYHIDAVKLDGTNVKSQLVGNELTIRNMTADKNLTVTFEADKNEPDEPVVTTENTLTLSNVTANIGTTVTFPVGLNNVDEITALQMDLHLPTGITLATDGYGDVKIETTNRVSNKHTVDCSKIADGSYRIICYSTKNNTFTGNSGELFSLSLVVGSELMDGDYEITATNIEMSDMTGTAHFGQDVKGVVTVKSYMPGDVDGNGQHSINDVVCIVNCVLNRPNTTFIEAAADLDGNGDISINDAVLLISKYILGTNLNMRKVARAAIVNNKENYMCIDDVTMQPGDVKTIEVMMVNERDDIRGLQCDITLPEGISFLYDEETEDYVTTSSRIPKKLALNSEMQNENTLRVAGVCTGPSCIYGNAGSVFTFKVKADENIMAGMYEIKMLNMELSYGEAIDVADRTSVLEILDEANGIATIFSNGNENSEVYDLSGRRIDDSMTQKGLFIINGKKVIVK